MFKQHIDTAPVIEAFAAGGECPLCTLRDTTEEGYLTSFLGGSVMEPSARVLINASGFCHKHFEMLYNANNHLGVALMAHSHMKEVIARLDARWSSRPRGKLAGLLGKRAVQPDEQTQSPVNPLGYSITCAFCERLITTMERYVSTTIILLNTDKKFREQFEGSLGICVGHADALISAAKNEPTRQLIIDVALKNLNRVEQDLDWFTRKFDYRNRDAPWGNAKDALPRALQKLASVNLADKPETKP